jgi:hypothetical protein
MEKRNMPSGENVSKWVKKEKERDYAGGVYLRSDLTLN